MAEINGSCWVIRSPLAALPVARGSMAARAGPRRADALGATGLGTQPGYIRLLGLPELVQGPPTPPARAPRAHAATAIRAPPPRGRSWSRVTPRAGYRRSDS